MARRLSDMTHHRPRLAGGTMLATRVALAAMTNRHPDMISRHAEPIACDIESRLELFDAEAVDAQIRRLRRRVA